MGYKKLDEIMELLTDELDGFNRAIDRLERLTRNVDNIEIRPDTFEIERLLQEHHTAEKAKSSEIYELVVDMEKRISKARIIPKPQLWLHYSMWLISLAIIGYLAFKVSRIDNIQEKAFAEGGQQVISSLREYFDQNPEHYQSYQKWVKAKDSVPNRK